MPLKEKGLNSQEVAKRFKQFGPNLLPEKPPPSNFIIFLSQLRNPLVYVLLLAGVATLLLGHISDTVIISLAVLINAVLGFVQERKASRALHALKKLIEYKAQVIRDGKTKTVDVANLVPGDLVIISQGSKIPADGKLITANNLSISEAILTGESSPVSKKEEEAVFMGTTATSGSGVMRVETTGGATEIGKIAIKVQEPDEETPLKRQLGRLSKQLSVLVFVLIIFVFTIGILTGKEFFELAVTSIALAVSAIPEGLLVGLTVVLAIGMQRILSRNGLVRRLVSAETLGGVTTICIDKTGTLTKGVLEVADIVGEESEIARQMVLANDLDDPLLVTAYEWATKAVGENLAKEKRLETISFSPEKRFFAALNKSNSSANTIYVNGAPEYILSWCSLDAKQKAQLLKKVDVLTQQGKRVIGLGRKPVPANHSVLKESDVKSGLDWVGMIAFWDPIRQGVKESLEMTVSSGIKLLVITGDYPQTAVSVMNELGIKPANKEVIMGSQLEKMSVEVLARRLPETKLFARTSPAQKEKIVAALKKRGEVVAMMGDGVNDAPALNSADIGIVVGDATDVARESADLVLLDSNFATVVAAIEEGRGIFDNIRKIILYLLSDSFEEIVAVVAAMLFVLPLPVSAAQILWINLISDGFPNLALTVDPKREKIMKGAPRSPREGVVAGWMKGLIIIVSLAGGLSAFILFAWTYKTQANLELSRSIAFAALGINSLVYVFSIKTLRDPFWRDRVLNNKWLLLAVVAGLGLQISPFLVPGLGRFLGVIPLNIGQWGIVFASSVLMFIIIEISKSVFRLTARTSKT